MTNSTDLLPIGLADRLPASARAITLAMRAALDAVESHGYDRVRPPLLEFESSLGSRMDGVETQKMFRFVDPASLRTLALRSDITPQIGRIAATSLKDASRPLRLAYCGDTALIAASQLDPARERLQLGAELIGADTVAAVSEVVVVAIDACQSAGLTGLSVDFTLPDLVDTLASQDLSLDPKTIERIRQELDTKDAGGLADAGGEAYLPLLYATGPFDEALSALRKIDIGGALGTRLDGLEQVAARIPDDVRMTLDPTELHGFGYQSWFGFTIYADAVRGAAGRGGSYTIAGTKEAATGFTLYVDRIADATPAPEPTRKVYLPLGHDATQAAELRAQGWQTCAQLAEGEKPTALGCTHVLEGSELRALS